MLYFSASRVRHGLSTSDLGLVTIDIYIYPLSGKLLHDACVVRLSIVISSLSYIPSSSILWSLFIVVPRAAAAAAARDDSELRGR